MNIIIFPEREELYSEEKTVRNLLKSLSLREEEVLVIDVEKRKLLTHDSRLKYVKKLEIRKITSAG